MDPVSSIITKALDGLSMRAEVTANNIANVNSQAFRPSRVRFEEALRAAAAQDPAAVARIMPEIEQVNAAIGSEAVRLDLELATASETALRYDALVEILGRRMQISHIAIGGQ